MKNLLLTTTALLCLALAGCKATLVTNPIKYLQKNVVGAVKYDPITKTTTAHYEIDSVWQWKQAKHQGVQSAKICLDAVQGKVSGTLVLDSTHVITKQYAKQVSKKK